MVTTRRFLSLTCESLVGPAELVLELQPSVIPSVALELTLLALDMVESLRLDPTDGPSLVLTVLGGDRVSKALVQRESDGAIRFAVGKNQAEYLQAVVLRAYRDQVAEVSHIHIEGEAADGSFDLTVMFETFARPLSADEAARRLGE